MFLNPHVVEQWNSIPNQSQELNWSGFLLVLDVASMNDRFLSMFFCFWFFMFSFQSAVMSATFAKFHPNLVVGGTYSGQIVLWDNRSNKRTPVQRTPLSAAAHTVGGEISTKTASC